MDTGFHGFIKTILYAEYFASFVGGVFLILMTLTNPSTLILMLGIAIVVLCILNILALRLSDKPFGKYFLAFETLFLWVVIFIGIFNGKGAAMIAGLAGIMPITIYTYHIFKDK